MAPPHQIHNVLALLVALAVGLALETVGAVLAVAIAPGWCLCASACGGAGTLWAARRA